MGAFGGFDLIRRLSSDIKSDEGKIDDDPPRSLTGFLIAMLVVLICLAIPSSIMFAIIYGLAYLLAQ